MARTSRTISRASSAIPRSMWALLACVVGGAALVACSPTAGEPESAEDLSEPAAGIQDTLRRYQDTWLDTPGVEGVGIGECDGAPCIKVMSSVPPEELRPLIPSLVDGHAVVIEETGAFGAQDAAP